MKKIAILLLLVTFLVSSCAPIPAQTWQPKAHPPQGQKYKKKRF